MSSIKLDNLSKTNRKINDREAYYDSIKDYTYVDIYLDLQSDKIPDVNGQADNNRDLRVAPDELAIKNSLINLFNTRPGERILIPTYGVNLLGYVFENVTVTTARALGLQVQHAIEKWERRVRVNKIKVLADPDNNEYRMTVEVIIPQLTNTSVSFTGILSNEGFTETNNSEFI
jgi:phage baseplate assembly protein W